MVYVETIIIDHFEPKKRPQQLAALAAALGALALGTAVGWTSPAIPSLEITRAFYALSDSQKSGISSIVPFAAACAAPLAGFFINKLGRKRTILLLAIPFFIGWMLIANAASVTQMLFGRFVTGFCGGAYSVAIPVYVSEVADADIRGTLGSLFQLFITIGILFAYVVGYLVEWSWLALICSIVPVLLFASLFFMPESPRHLLSKGKVNEASRAICWLRGAGLSINVDSELKVIQDSIEDQHMETMTIRELFSRAILVPFGISLALMFFQQLSGINAFIFYTVEIFREAGSHVHPNIATIIVGVVAVLGTLVASVLVDREGRRRLLIASEVFSIASLVLMGAYFFIESRAPALARSIGWIPLLALMIFIVGFSIGLGPLPWLMMAELTPEKLKGTTSGIAASFNWALAFLVTFFFGTFRKVIGLAWCYWTFGLVCIAGLAYIYYVVPETKGKSLDEIREEFDRRRERRARKNQVGA